MAKKTPKEIDEVADLLKDILITLLGTAGVQQTRIREVVGCDMNRVSRIVKLLKPKRASKE
jgi:hypothetical protein